MIKKNILAKGWMRWEGIIGNIVYRIAYYVLRISGNKNHHKTLDIRDTMAKRKLLLFSLLIILIGLPILYLSLRYQSKTEAAWMDDSWTYRQTIAITNSGSAQTDYQVSIGIGTSALINVGKMKSDCSDIRVTDINGKLLPIWMETGTYACNTSSTHIWTKVPSIPTSGATLYIYYGNPSAANVSDISWMPSGGTITLSGGYRIHTFTSSGTITTNANLYVETLVVAGGGSGGSSQNSWGGGGGGGGGGLISNSAFAVSPQLYSITVGGGGAGVTNGRGLNGGNSVFSTLTAVGGGGGGYGGSGNSEGLSGGSGGGAGYNGYSTSTIGSGTAGQGNDGGQNGAPSGAGGGGGGGAGSAGNAPTNSPQHNGGVGGSGTASSISGASVTYAAGGNGGGSSNGAGTANTGNGGSGTYSTENSSTSYAGGSGIVIIRYPSTTGPSVAAPTNEEKSQGPVAYWKFDEGYGTTAHDSTTNGNNGTLSGDTVPTWQTEDLCIAGKCLLFSNSKNNYVSIPNSPTINSLSSFTYTAWIKRGAANNYMAVIGSSTSGNADLRFDGNGTTLYFFVNGGSQASFGVLDQNVWYHVAATWDGSNKRVYLNGVLKDTSGSTAPTFTDTSIYIGRRANANDSFNGFIDEPKIYPYARTAAQIKSDYAAGLAHSGAAKGISASMGSNSKNNSALSDGLVGYWKLDETSSPALDSSGVGSTGTWNGNVASTATNLGIGSSFDGNGDYIDAGNKSSVNFGSGSFTMTAWAKTSDTGNYKTIISKGASNSGATSRYYMRIEATTGNFHASLGDGTDEANIAGVASGLHDGDWHFLVTVVDRATQTMRTYVDGVQDDSTSITAIGDIDSSTSLRIGMLGTQGYYYKGMMDEVRLYNRALSPKEVSDLYNWAPGPVGYWNFEEGSGSTTFDSSGVGNTGTWQGTLGSQWSIGKYGKSGQFNGTDNYVNIADQTNVRPTNFTISAWVYPQSPVVSSLRTIVMKGASNYTNDFFIKADNTLAFYQDSTTGYIFNGVGSVVNNKWNHVSITKNGNSYVLYVNGIGVGSTSIGSGSVVYDALAWTIGKGNPGGTNGEMYRGSIDEFKIYNYAITAKQVVADMNAGHPAVGSPVGSALGHWKFDEGQGIVANNSGSGGSALNGTLASSPNIPSWTNNGKFGKALSFDGLNDPNGDYVSLPNSTLNGLTSGTISTWFRLDDGDKTLSDYNAIFAYGGQDASEYMVAYAVWNSNVFVYRNDTGLTNTTVGCGTVPLSSVWYNLTLTWDDTDMRCYINGKFKGKTDGNFDPEASQDTRIGGVSNRTNYNFEGQIDEFKLYNYALTADEVKMDYNRGAAMVLGTLSDNSSYDKSAANQEYCIPGDTSVCASPVARWDFEEGSGSIIYDSSGVGNTGSWNGTGSPHWSIGKAGKAGNFNGTDDYVASKNIMTGVTAFTASAWVNFDQNESNYVFSQNALNDWTGFTASVGDTGMGFTVYNGGGGSYDDYTRWSALPISKNTWHQVVYQWDSSHTMKMYLDGILIGGTFDSAGTQPTSVATTQPFRIGVSRTSHASGALMFDGQIDQVRVYNYVRSAAQIAWDYNRGGPVAHWKFDEGQGTSLVDATGNGNTGNINIGASGTQTSAGTLTTSGTAWGNGATGKFNYSLNFDGNDDYVVQDSADYRSLDSQGTIAAWIKLSSTGNYYLIFGSADYASSNRYLELFVNSSSKLAFAQWNADGVSDTNVSANNTTLSSGTWYHVVVTSDSSTYKIYINGINQALTVNTGSNNGDWFSDTDNRDNWTIGQLKYNSTLVNPFDGQIDDVRTYNYALTATQIKNLYNGGAALRFGPSTGAP